MRLFYFLAMTGMIAGISDAAIAQYKVHHKRTRTLVHAISIPSITAVVPAVYGSSVLGNELNRIIAADNAGADIAVYVKSMKYGDALYARNIHRPLTPASTMKVLTAEAALIYLGPEYHFSTQLLTNAKGVKNGVLQGNLYVVLSGDPSLTYDDLDDLLLTLKAHQIQAIAGNVYIDNTAYDQSFYGPGWIWKDKSYCYARLSVRALLIIIVFLFKWRPLKF